MTYLPRLASIVYNQPHFITPTAAATIIQVLQDRIGGEIDANSFIGVPARDEKSGRRMGYRVTQKGTAIIPITGELVNRGAWLGASSGLVSYEGLRQQFEAVAKDVKVQRVVLDVDSPGGQAAGMLETAASLRALAKKKPVVAFANTLMASAAYGISSGATKIIATEFATVGSIGVVYVHADHSRELDRKGVTVSMIHAGARKVDGNPYEPLSERVRDEIQGLVNKHYAAFVACVLDGRPELTESSVKKTEARCYDTDDAIKAGLADGKMTFDEMLQAFESNKLAGPTIGALTAPPAQLPQPKGVHTMYTQTGLSTDAPGFSEMTVGELSQAIAVLRTQLDVPEAQQVVSVPDADAMSAVATSLTSVDAQSATAANSDHENRETIFAEGACAERKRIRNILNCEAAKTRPLQASVIALESDMSEADATAMLAKLPAEAAQNATADLYKAIAASGGDPKVPHADGGDLPDPKSDISGQRERLRARFSHKQKGQ